MLKYKIISAVVFLICIMLVSYTNAATNQYPLLGKVIYIDPGHGGVDPGAIYKDIKESDINLEISKELEQSLSQLGAIVYVTRYGDYDLAVPNTINRKRSDLSRRGNIINRSGCDIYLSIHLNAVESPTWYGAQVFYDDVNENNVKLAKIMQKEFESNLRTRRKMKETSELYLHKRIERPGILIEAGFISNANERYLLRQKNYQKKLSNTITNAVVKYFESNK